MRPSLLAIAVSVTFVSAQSTLRAEDYFTPNLQVALASDSATNTSVEHRDFLLPYHEEQWPNKYLEWLWKDPANLFTRPAFWGGSQWATFGIEAGITGALMPVDRSYRDFSDDIHSKPLTHVLKPIDFVLGNYPVALISGGMFAGGLGLHNEKLADSGFLSLESVGYATLIDVGIKGLTERERPRDTHDPYQFLGPGGSAHGSSSFVSGDAIAAFAFASSVSEVWQTPWITWPLYALATAVAFQRTEADAHWLSDVVGAAFLGHAIGKTIVHMHYRHDIEGRLMPYVADHVVGLQLAFEF
ncbi:MAG: phosphatase PAP2 family protein [Verrucomicrobiia bacterium]